MEDKNGDLEAIKEKALSIVDDVIKGAADTVRGLQKKEEEKVAGAKYEVPNIKWMQCKDFTIGKGLLEIEEYMRTWELHESWLHWTNYLNDEELKYSTRYYYRVRWSIPTCRKPIPRATACVYFILEISKVRPSTLPIEVYFIVETNKLIHRPGESRFKEKWLKDVIESKITMMETIYF
ncbi:A-kinase anchor protein 14 [Sceloporus undulatus]|uniref:A-kinase anchor protein 14 n=1 Tax=Sceloporus undulatus TaxID=8520 RepID=UPI001C4BE440|nr:A-kinase anchor protein 14 [Sceloporus undulatus]